MRVQIKRKKRQKINFEVIPLIDVMMVLCLFFAIAAFLPQIQNTIDTKLPESKSGDSSKEAIVVSINSSGTIYVKNKIVSKNELLKEIKDRIADSKDIPIVLAADENLKYNDVITVLDTIKQSGATQIGIATEK